MPYGHDTDSQEYQDAYTTLHQKIKGDIVCIEIQLEYGDLDMQYFIAMYTTSR